MSNQNEQTILVEKHYIPVSIYQQIYSNQHTNSSLSNSFINTPATNNIPPSMNLFGTNQQRPGNLGSNATIRTTRRTTFSTLNPATNHTTQHNNNLDEQEPTQNGQNTTTRADRTAGIRFETIDAGDDNDINLFNALFAALINPSRVGGANSNTDRQTGLTTNQIEDNSTVISYNNQPDNSAPDNQPSSSICSVCTLEYESGQQVRCLDVCDHAFHTGCIDRWLADHNTCPLCRSSVMPRTNTNTIGNRGSQPQTSSSRTRITTRVDLNGLD